MSIPAGTVLAVFDDPPHNPLRLRPGFVDPEAVRPPGNYCPVCGSHDDDPPRSSTGD